MLFMILLFHSLFPFINEAYLHWFVFVDTLIYSTRKVCNIYRYFSWRHRPNQLSHVCMYIYFSSNVLLGIIKKSDRGVCFDAVGNIEIVLVLACTEVIIEVKPCRWISHYRMQQFHLWKLFRSKVSGVNS